MIPCNYNPEVERLIAKFENMSCGQTDKNASHQKNAPAEDDAPRLRHRVDGRIKKAIWFIETKQQPPQEILSPSKEPAVVVELRQSRSSTEKRTRPSEVITLPEEARPLASKNTTEAPSLELASPSTKHSDVPCYSEGKLEKEKSLPSPQKIRKKKRAYGGKKRLAILSRMYKKFAPTQGKKKNNYPAKKHKAQNFLPNGITLCPEKEVYSLQEHIIPSNPKYTRLHLADLSDAGLLPKYKYEKEGAIHYVTDPFCLNRSHIARIALIKIGDRVYTRVYYHSNSQGTWRVMPAWHKVRGRFNHFGKGCSETDTQLPIDFCVALNALPPPSEGIRIEYPTAQNLVKSGWDITQTWKDCVILDPFVTIQEGAKASFYSHGNRIHTPSDPASIRMPEDANSHPDFSHGTSFPLEIPEYGKVFARVYYSKDRTLKYLFYEMQEDGRAFLASVEGLSDNPITIFGVRQQSKELKGMDTPLLEYWEQIQKNYKPLSNAPKYQSHKYRNNWNFVRELAIIQMYYEKQGRQIPAPV